MPNCLSYSHQPPHRWDNECAARNHRFSLLLTDFNTRLTRQMVHISRNCKGLYLSQTALKDLEILDKGFPNHKGLHLAAAIRSPNDDAAKSSVCKCPPRTKTPDRPDSIPMEASPENVTKLKNWLVSAFASSTFNTCTHQPFPKMTGSAVHVKFQEDVIPHAVHTPTQSRIIGS